MEVIYALVDPRTSLVRYIGYTNNLNRRLYEHRKDAVNGEKDHRSRWIRQVLADGLEVECRVLQETTRQCWEEDEKFYIRFYREEVEAPLVNVHPGGSRPGYLHHTHRWTAESRQKVSRSLKLLDQSVLSCKRSKAVIGKSVPADRRASISRRLMGHEVSSVTKRRISIANEIFQMNIRRLREGKLPVS